VLSAP